MFPSPPLLLLLLLIFLSYSLPSNLEYSPASAYLASTLTARTPNRTTFLSSFPAYSFSIHSTHRPNANRAHLSCFFHSITSSPFPLHANRNRFIFLIARSTALLSSSSVNVANATASHATSYARPCIPPSVGNTFSPATDANNFFAFAEVFEAPTATEECSTRTGTCAIFRSFEAGGTTNSLLLLLFKSEEYSGAAAAKFDSRDAFALPPSSSSFRLLFLARLPRVFCGCFPSFAFILIGISLSLIVFAKRWSHSFRFYEREDWLVAPLEIEDAHRPCRRPCRRRLFSVVLFAPRRVRIGATNVRSVYSIQWFTKP